MNVYVFSGPTLSRGEIRAELDAVCLPPVSQGDVYRIARGGARAIGIIDGYFERVPAVWHKELLWAMAQGTHVYGSASMGALRAAELAAFGMEGVGAIFEAYRDGTLEDDDDVAIRHGPAETSYRCLSEALVNIRATLARAAAEAVISSACRAALERIAKDLFYPDRSYPQLLQRGAKRGLPTAELESLRTWLASHRIDQKRQDALAMLRAMRQHVTANLEPKRVSYQLEHTVYWDNLMRSAGAAEAPLDGESTTLTSDALLDELRLDGDRYRQVREQALLRDLTLAAARQQGSRPSTGAVQESERRFLQARGLCDATAKRRWLEDNDLPEGSFEELIGEETLVDQVWSQRKIIWPLLDQLRLTGEYWALRERARDKQHRLEAVGLLHPRLDEVGLSQEELLRWHFGRVNRPVEADLKQYAHRLGYGHQDELILAALREYCYTRLTNQERHAQGSEARPELT